MNNVTRTRKALHAQIALDLLESKTYMATAVSREVSLGTVYSVSKQFAVRGKDIKGQEPAKVAELIARLRQEISDLTAGV